MPSVAELKKRREGLQGVRDRIDHEAEKLAKEGHELHKRIVAQHKAADDARDRHDDDRLKEIKRRLVELAENREDVRKEIEDLEHREKSVLERIKLLYKRIRHKKKEQAAKDEKVVLTAGSPHWGGSDDIIRAETDPVAAAAGVPVTSRKRSASDPLTIANPGSDHSVLATLASAADYGTFNGSSLAYACARALGISGYSTGNYNGYTIYRAGAAFRVQILWAVEGHFNHVHVGIRRV